MKNMSKRIMLTGGAGFIGHHLLEHLLSHTDYEIVCLDRLDTSGSLHRMHEVLESEKGIKKRWKKRVSFCFHDLKSEINDIDQ